MAIIYSYPQISELATGDTIAISDASNGNKTKSVTVEQLETYINAGQATTTYVDDKVVSGAAFNTSTGVLTLTRTDGVDVTQNLDGRYALTSSLAAVATSGSYNDLFDKPTIPPAYTNADVDAHLNTSTATASQVLSWTGSDYTWVAQSGGGGGGTVTSVAATAGTGISITGSPITTSGELVITNTAPNTITNLSTAYANNIVTINSSDGTNATINAATTSTAGVMTAADKTKLDGVATGATANLGIVQTLTTTGTSGAATLVGGTLNIPQYSGGGGGVTSIIAGTGIGIDQSTGDVTITNTGSATGGYTTLTRTFNGSELVDAFNGTAGDEIVLVTVPAGYQAVLSGEAVAYVDYNTGTTDYTGPNLVLKINALSSTNFISLSSVIFTSSGFPFYITNGQTDSNNIIGTSNLGENITLISNSTTSRANFTAGDRDFILSFTYRLINLNL